MTRVIDVGALLDGSSWSAYQKLLTAIAALAVVFDGFDIQILGFAIPSLASEWHVTRGAFGPALALGMAGMMLGSAVAGHLGDRFGRRLALIVCVVVFGLATVGTSLVQGFWGLSVLRLITGLGTGGALPNVSALSAEFAPLRRRPTAVKLTLLCVPLGGMLGASCLPGSCRVWDGGGFTRSAEPCSCCSRLCCGRPSRSHHGSWRAVLRSGPGWPGC